MSSKLGQRVSAIERVRTKEHTRVVGEQQTRAKSECDLEVRTKEHTMVVGEQQTRAKIECDLEGKD